MELPHKFPPSWRGLVAEIWGGTGGPEMCPWRAMAGPSGCRQAARGAGELRPNLRRSVFKFSISVNEARSLSKGPAWFPKWQPTSSKKLFGSIRPLDCWLHGGRPVLWRWARMAAETAPAGARQGPGRARFPVFRPDHSSTTWPPQLGGNLWGSSTGVPASTFRHWFPSSMRFPPLPLGVYTNLAAAPAASRGGH